LTLYSKLRAVTFQNKAIIIITIITIIIIIPTITRYLPHTHQSSNTKNPCYTLLGSNHQSSALPPLLLLLLHYKSATFAPA